MATVELGILTVHVPASLHQVCRGHRPRCCCCCSLRRRHGRSIQTSLCGAHGNDESRFVAPSSFPHVLKMNRPKKKKACIIHGALANDAGEQQGMSFSMILNS